MSVLQTSIIVYKLERIPTTDDISQSKSGVGPRNDAWCARELIWNSVVNNQYHPHHKAQDESTI